MLIIPAPNNRDGIGQALADALGVSIDQVLLVGDDLHVDAPDSARAMAEQTVRDYTPPPAPADPEAEFRAALSAATTVPQLRDALLGKAGPGAQARRPSGN